MDPQPDQPKVSHQAVISGAGYDPADICEGMRGADRMRMCVDACPTSALASPEPAEAVRLDRAACISCGICVSVCPTGAVELPGQSWAEMWASIRGAAEAVQRQPAGTAPFGFLWTCPRTEMVPSGWASSRVPCTAALDVRSILAPLVAGFAVVGIAHCGEGCISGQLDMVREKVSFCNDLLSTTAPGEDAVRLFTGGSIPERPTPDGTPSVSTPRSGEIDPYGIAAARAALGNDGDPPSLREILLAFSPDDGSSSRSRLSNTVAGSASPLGIVTIDEAACTLCGSCAAACPTGALVFGKRPTDDTASGSRGASDEVSLRFDHGECVACSNCVDVCPEASRGAIDSRAAVDFSLLQAGVRTLAVSAINRCPACGEETISQRVVERVAEILGNSFSASMRLCNAYKGPA